MTRSLVKSGSTGQVNNIPDGGTLNDGGVQVDLLVCSDMSLGLRGPSRTPHQWK